MLGRRALLGRGAFIEVVEQTLRIAMEFLTNPYNL